MSCPLGAPGLRPTHRDHDKRIRELEAERETWVASIEAANRAQKAYRDEKARAEKAEADVDRLAKHAEGLVTLRKNAEENLRLVKLSEERLKDRLAELETFLLKYCTGGMTIPEYIEWITDRMDPSHPIPARSTERD